MIIVKAIGGLGNQLFQYALGKHLSMRNSVPFKLDVSKFATYSLHEFSLRYFDVQWSEADRSELEMFFPLGRLTSRFFRFRDRVRRKTSRSIYRERDRQFDCDVFSVGDSVYLDGYWQSEKYFKPVAEQLRKEFVVNEPMGQIDKRIADEIASAAVSIGVHIRRGNYSTDPGTLAHHGTCSPAYYAQALAYIQARFSDISLFVFSDDVDWVRKNGSLDGYRTTYVDHNQGFDGKDYVHDKNYQDLRLLSLCDHQIIANSTFSWWAAWLNTNSEKQVIAPRMWFADGSPCDDIVPESWVRL